MTGLDQAEHSLGAQSGVNLMRTTQLPHVGGREKHPPSTALFHRDPALLWGLSRR